MFHKRLMVLALCGVAAGLPAGCADRPTILPNPDPSLRKTRTELRVDAARRFPYQDELPRAAEPGVRAAVGYSTNRLDLLNFTGADWEDVEVWVNGRYVCHLPRMEDRTIKRVHFAMLMDEEGNRFPSDNRQVRVEKVEMLREGRLYHIHSYVGDR
jgi:hypothetical protein